MYLFAKPKSAEALLAWAFEDREKQNAFSPAVFMDSTTVAAGEMFEHSKLG